MHYYKKNIGDYHKKAGRLTMLQHGAYTLLMDAIYDREEFPTMDEAIDWLWASSKEEIEAVEFVLKKFFKVKDGRYYQGRMVEVIEEYTGQCMANQINGKKGGRPKGAKNKPKETQPVNNKTHSVKKESEKNPSESEKKPKPLTTNHKPLTTNQEPTGLSIPPVNAPDSNSNTLSDLENYDQMQLDQITLETGPSPFERFWEAYDKKEKRKDCEKKWKSKGLDLIIEHLLTDIANRKANCNKWRDVNGIQQFKSGPLPYLNGELWNDAIQPKPLGGHQMTSQEKEQKENDEWEAFKVSEAGNDIQGECNEISD